MLLPLMLFALVLAWVLGFLFHEGVRRNRYLPIPVLVIAITASYLTYGQVSERFGRIPSFRDCPDCPELVLAPKGPFAIGSLENEPGRRKDEAWHAGMIARGFAAGMYAVTFEQWDACVAGGGCGGYVPADEGWGRASWPVINVNWNDAKAYAAWLSKKTGKTYRLLSEAEREYIARAGAGGPFWWGGAISAKDANYDSSRTYAGGVVREGMAVNLHAAKVEAAGARRTVPVDSFAPNPLGFYQVHGNVWEWTVDCWNDSLDANRGDGSAQETGDCGRRVLKGGAWNSDPADLRSAARIAAAPDARNNAYGFRVARDLGR
jgi:formylglycine-generating enzyme required for sulfatase activity